MNAAGIDISSKRSTAALLRPFGEVVRLPFDVAHSTKGLVIFSAQLKAFDGEDHVVMGYTGRCYEPAAKALHEAGPYVSAGNPLYSVMLFGVGGMVEQIVEQVGICNMK